MKQWSKFSNYTNNLESNVCCFLCSEIAMQEYLFYVSGVAGHRMAMPIIIKLAEVAKLNYPPIKDIRSRS